MLVLFRSLQVARIIAQQEIERSYLRDICPVRFIEGLFFSPQRKFISNWQRLCTRNCMQETDKDQLLNGVNGVFFPRIEHQ
jgi:hypothetical protein